MKRVLFVSDSFTGGGLETRILEQVAEYQKHGVKCLLAYHVATKELMRRFDGYYYLPETTTNLETVSACMAEIKAICEKEQIDFIDCQPLYGFVPAALAAAELNIPITYTIHGMYSLPTCGGAYEALFKLLLQKVARNVIVVAGFLLEKYNDMLDGARTLVVNNGIVPTTTKVTQTYELGYFAFASRLDETKTKLFIEALPELERLGVAKIDVYGDGAGSAELEKIVASEKTKIQLNLLGWKGDLREELIKHNYEGALGMGRVVVEAMSVNLPAIVIGYAGLAGVMSEKSFEKFLFNNFTSWEHGDEKQLKKDFAAMRTQRKDYCLQKLVAKRLSATKIWRNLLRQLKTSR